ncbi:IS30 family transposase [Turicibacter sanguinis]|nr:IS30 family transposase [Turicibacter sanguinis]
MSYNHLNTFERTRIEVLSKMGYSARQIAVQLNRHHSTIARELKRNTQQTYQVELADELAWKRRLVCHRPETKSEEVIQTIQHYLKLTWSPEQISNTVLKGVLSFKTIYRWIYDGTILLGDLNCLRQKGKPRETRGRFNIGTSIHQRPKEVKNRETFGHWELDNVVSSRGKSKGCLATFVERQTRFYVAVKIDNRSALEMYRAISELYEHFPKDTFKTYTVDRGKEFACYSKVEADLKVPVYFADAYSSWQRGSNENANGLLRKFFPKKTDLARVSDEEIDEALCLINHRPRKCLGWKTSFELFHEKLSHLY